jgi:hypothetical protein
VIKKQYYHDHTDWRQKQSAKQHESTAVRLNYVSALGLEQTDDALLDFYSKILLDRFQLRC